MNVCRRLSWTSNFSWSLSSIRFSTSSSRCTLALVSSMSLLMFSAHSVLWKASTEAFTSDVGLNRFSKDVKMSHNSLSCFSTFSIELPFSFPSLLLPFSFPSPSLLLPFFFPSPSLLLPFYFPSPSLPLSIMINECMVVWI